MRLLPRAALLAGAVLTGACATQAAPAAEPTLANAQAAYARGDYAAASVDYESVARGAAGPFADDYWLLAADCALRAGDAYRADQLLNRVNGATLDDHQAGRLQLLRGEAALGRNDAAGALKLLPENSNDPTLRDALLLARGRALYRLDDPVAATSTLVRRETQLASSDAVQANHSTIWLGVSTTPPRPLAPGQAVDTVTRGWLELGRLAQQSASLAELDAWRKRYPGHPGEEHLAQLMMPGRSGSAAETAAPPAAVATTAPAVAAPLPAPPGMAPVAAPLLAGGGGVALLLPLSGPLAAAGASVRDAFSAALPAQVYDTGATPDGVLQAYRRAVAEGAGLAVGPLVKEGAVALAASGSLPVPVLTLNYLDGGAHVDGLYQFGLAPEDEAAAAADDAYARGLRRAVAMAPTGEWGERVLAAFRNRLTLLGGGLVDVTRYVPGTNDYGTPIRTLLKLDAAEARHRAVSSALGVSTEFTAQPRSDIDFVFVAGRAAQERLIVPQLRYYRAQELPIYATSAAYDGGGGGDLDGLRVCDVPALMRDGASGPVDVARLTALGRDAAQLAQAIRSHGLAPETTLDGATGRLSVDGSGVIHRQLGCAAIADTALRPVH